MANEFIKAEQVAAQALGLLVRDSVLLNFVWRDPVGNFKGAKNDTVTIRVPAYTTARERVMRSATAIVIDDLSETSVDVKLDTHVYKAVRVTDEEMTLDITDFGLQVNGPASSAVVRKVDAKIATAMAGGSYEVTETVDPDDPYAAIVRARIALNQAGVPMDGRFLAVGAEIEADLLLSDRLAKFDQSGSSDALREATVGRIAGFTAVSVPGLDPDIAVAGHRSSFTASLVAPEVPAGAAWGTRQNYQGLTLRVLRDYLPDDTAGPADRFLADTFMGVSQVKDSGTIDADGNFQPSDDGADTPIGVRAVKLSLTGS